MYRKRYILEIFSEEINLFKALGAVVVLAGVALYAVADNATEEKG